MAPKAGREVPGTGHNTARFGQPFSAYLLPKRPSGILQQDRAGLNLYLHLSMAHG